MPNNNEVLKKQPAPPQKKLDTDPTKPRFETVEQALDHPLYKDQRELLTKNLTEGAKILLAQTQQRADATGVTEEYVALFDELEKNLDGDASLDTTMAALFTVLNIQISLLQDMNSDEKFAAVAKVSAKDSGIPLLIPPDIADAFAKERKHTDTYLLKRMEAIQLSSMAEALRAALKKNMKDIDAAQGILQSQQLVTQIQRRLAPSTYRKSHLTKKDLEQELKREEKREKKRN